MTARLTVLTLLLLATAVCLRASTTQERVPPHRPLAEMPRHLGEWTAQGEREFDAATLAVLRADDYVSRPYTRPNGDLADLYVGYYQSQREGDTVHSPMNCLPGAGWQLLAVGRSSIEAAPGRSILVNRDVVQQGLDTRLVLYWYQSHGRAVASEYWSRAYLVLDGLRLHRTDGSLIRVISPIRDADAAAVERGAADFVRALAPVLNRHLPE